MNRAELTGEEWEAIYGYLKGHPRIYIGDASDCRRFVNAVIWILRSGSPWRVLPAEKGQWNTVFKRFARWRDHGVWSGLFRHVSLPADLEQVLLDSTVVRAHSCAAGAKKAPPKPNTSAVRAAALARRFTP